MSSGKRIVVVGGGAAGSQIAKSLSQQLSDGSSITLIEAREYYPHYIGSLRAVVTEEGGLEDKVLIPLDKLFTKDNGRVVHETVASISANAGGNGGNVVTSNGATYPYDVLVVATGNTWDGPLAFPNTRSETVSHINKWRKQFRDANGIAIVGGGPVGCELAGELRDVYKDKAITIVQRETRLLSAAYPEKYRRYVDQRWTERGITLITDDEVPTISAYPATHAMTKKGVSLNADLIVPCWGGRPNTDFLKSLGNNVLTSRGHVRVDQHLQIDGMRGIFAAGDIIDWDEVKQAVKYTAHTTTIVTNIKRLVSNSAPTAVYKSPSEVILLTNGVNGGAAYLGLLWGIVFGDWFVKMAKSKDLFITMTRKTLGY
ncbi:hypothetical protein CVT24_006334 [Panaeolus cyanescens]|uniref:FAD/NAD(P)-binding domain-containing protein n=1 Tax=Panaeolus cyanescens TaxID=181874 RepID=A0A409YE87_9AGAR|nr:hypothetical protein CVT24_006334 [Panaeolus cyanescens]